LSLLQDLFRITPYLASSLLCLITKIPSFVNLSLPSHSCCAPPLLSFLFHPSNPANPMGCGLGVLVPMAQLPCPGNGLVLSYPQALFLGHSGVGVWLPRHSITCFSFFGNTQKATLEVWVALLGEPAGPTDSIQRLRCRSEALLLVQRKEEVANYSYLRRISQYAPRYPFPIASTSRWLSS